MDRHSVVTLCLVSLLALPALALTRAVEPADPTSREPVTLIVSELDSCPGPPTVTRTGHRIDVVLGSGICLSAPTEITWRLELGVLPAGRYTVTLTDNGQPFRHSHSTCSRRTEFASSRCWDRPAAARW
jgi:hypothetical protein